MMLIVEHGEREFEGIGKCFICGREFRGSGYVHEVKVSSMDGETIRNVKMYICSKECLTKLLVVEHIVLIDVPEHPHLLVRVEGFDLDDLDDEELEYYFEEMDKHLIGVHGLSRSDLDKVGDEANLDRLIERVIKVLVG